MLPQIAQISADSNFGLSIVQFSHRFDECIFDDSTIIMMAVFCHPFSVDDGGLWCGLSRKYKQ